METSTRRKTVCSTCCVLSSQIIVEQQIFINLVCDKLMNTEDSTRLLLMLDQDIDPTPRLTINVDVVFATHYKLFFFIREKKLVYFHNTIMET